METSKIGTIEAIALIVIVGINHIILNLPKSIINSTGSAASLNVIYVSIIIFVVCALIIKLFKNFPNSDIFDMSEFIGGAKLRFIVGLIYSAFLIFVVSGLIRYFSESIRLIYLPNTPIEIVLLLFALIACIGNKFGFNAISKCNLIILPIVLVSCLVIFLSASNDFVPQRVFPILGYGAKETFITRSYKSSFF